MWKQLRKWWFGVTVVNQYTKVKKVESRKALEEIKALESWVGKAHLKDASGTVEMGPALAKRLAAMRRRIEGSD